MRRTAHAQQYYQTRLNAYSLPLKAVDRIHWSSVNFSYKNWTAELWRYTIYEHTQTTDILNKTAITATFSAILRSIRQFVETTELVNLTKKTF